MNEVFCLLLRIGILKNITGSISAAQLTIDRFDPTSIESEAFFIKTYHKFMIAFDLLVLTVNYPDYPIPDVNFNN